MRRPIAAALLSAHLAVLLYLTLFLYPQDHPSPNLRPFKTINRDRHVGSDRFLFNFVGNLAALAPFGFLLPLVWPGRMTAWRVVAAAAALSASIEVTQYLSGRRVADVDDVILNTAGALIGYGAFAEARRWNARPAGR